MAPSSLTRWAPIASPWREALGVSLEALDRHRLRTVLSILGIVIGVAAVTAMFSVGEGARREVIRQVELLGIDNLVLRPKFSEAATGAVPGPAPMLTFDDVSRLRALVPFATAWSPIVERFGRLSGPKREENASVLGVAADYQRIMDLQPASGRLLASYDADRDRRVCVLGASLRERLFGPLDPVGRLVRIEGTPYTVVGVLMRRASPGSAGGTLSPRDLNTAALVPARPGTLLGRPAFADELWLRLPDDVPVAEGGAITAHALQKLHKGRQDFDLLVPRDLLDQRLKAQRTFSVVLGSIAALSLLVGGIGIMNMMLAAVLERTSEIGLRRAVGATKQRITQQFLLESVLMTIAGGLCGVVAGAVTAVGVAHYAGWPTHVSGWAVGVSLAISVAVGLFFGTYPALRAARLEPVDAVRYE
jgi:putative ABC transport system permease protein